MRVRIPSTGAYTYPDAVIVCQKPSFEDTGLDTLLNPQVLFEVLSDSTESYDRGLKLKGYKSIPSFVEYVLVSQHEVLVEHHAKQPDGSWIVREHGPGATFALGSVGVEIAVDLLYRNVFEEGAGAQA
jgi:Uma2 family endonuclease